MVNRIVHFSVSKLFDAFDYELDFSADDDNLTFLTAPNGYGKTTILSIMHCVLSGREFWPLDMPPFEAATITFENGDKLTVTCVPNDARYYVVHFYHADGTEDEWKSTASSRLLSNKTILSAPSIGSNVFDKLEKDFYLSPYLRNHVTCASNGEVNLIGLYQILLDDKNIEYLFIDSIDEGMHVAWMLDLGDRITKLRPDIQIIYATHSPTVINGRWKRCVDLYYVLNHDQDKDSEDD